MTRAAAAGLAAVLLLSGCGGDARGDLQRSVADLTAAANDRDADGVRDGAQTVLDRLDAALRAGDVTPEQGAVIRERTLAVAAAADSIDADLLARLEAERQAQEAQQRLEAERQAAAEAERQRLEQERRQAEADAKAAEQARKAEEEAARKAEEEARKQAEEDDEDDAPRGTGAPQPSPTPLP